MKTYIAIWMGCWSFFAYGQEASLPASPPTSSVEAPPLSSEVSSSTDAPPTFQPKEDIGIYGGVSFQVAPLLLYVNTGLVAGLGYRLPTTKEKLHIGLGVDVHLQGAAEAFNGPSTLRAGGGFAVRLDAETRLHRRIRAARGVSASMGLGVEYFERVEVNEDGVDEITTSKRLPYASASFEKYVTLFSGIRLGLGLSFSINPESIYPTIDLLKLGFIF
jgi:hypothetical protein